MPVMPATLRLVTASIAIPLESSRERHYYAAHPYDTIWRTSFKLILLSISTTYRGWFQAGGVVSGTDLMLSAASSLLYSFSFHRFSSRTNSIKVPSLRFSMVFQVTPYGLFRLDLSERMRIEEEASA